jgi:hypothetical protein
VRRGPAPGRFRVCPAEGDDYGRAGHPFSVRPNFLKLPAGEYLGESVAVATNSKGNIFVYHRRDTTRLFEFDKTGTFIKEIGKGYYGFEFAHSVRVDKDDNIWTVDEGTNLVTKFSPEGKGADGDRPQASRPSMVPSSRLVRTRRRRSTSSAARAMSASIRRGTSSSPTATATIAS